jgi:hypothetical protein
MTEDRITVQQRLKEEGFSPVGKGSYLLFRAYEYDNMLQERSAVIISSWVSAHDGLYKIINGYLCHVYFYDELPIYFVIHSPKNILQLQPIIDILYDLAIKLELPFLQIRYIENRFLEDYRAVPGYEITIEHKTEDNEYAYRIADLLELSGSDCYYKRKRVKKFMDRPDISLHPITNSNVRICTEIENEWCSHQDCDYCGYFCGCEKKAMETMMDIFDETIHTGVFLYHKDIPVGYIICEKRSEKLAFLYFGKANIQDGFVYLIYMMFRNYIKDVEYMNMNDEMGNLGLRQFKQHLSVYELWERKICTFHKKEGW